MKTTLRYPRLLALAFILYTSSFILPAFADPAASSFYQFNGGATATITSGTTVTLSRLGSLSTYILTLGTGSGPYTAQLVLPDTGFHSGDVYFIPVTYPASTNPRLQIFDSGTGGTLLHSSTGTAIAGSTVLRFVNVTGTAWSFNPEGAVLQRNLGAVVYSALGAAPNSSAGLLTGSSVGVYSAVSGLTVTSSAPGQFTLGGTPSLSGSAAQSGTAGALSPTALVPASQVRSFNPSALHSFGDSVTAGYYVAPAQAYPTLLANDLGAIVNNYAISGDLAADVAALQVFPNENPGATDNALYTIIVGTNDANTKGVGSYESVYNLNLQAILAWLAVPSPAKIFAQSAAAATTGTWANDNTYQSGIALSSTAHASTLSLPIATYGGPIYVWYRVWDGNAGAFTYAVDSGSANALTCYTSPSIATQNGGTQGVALARYAAVASGTHTVTFTVTSTTGTGNNVSILGIGTPPVAGQYWNPPAVFCGGVWEQQSNADAAATLEYNNDAQADAALLAGDGLGVYFVNIRNYVNDTTDMANTLHFNATGHLHLRNAFEQGIQAPVNFSKALGNVQVASLSGSLGGVLNASGNSITQLGPISMQSQAYPAFGTAPFNTEMAFLTGSPTDDYGFGLQNNGQWNFSVSYSGGGYNWWIGGTGTNTGTDEMSLEGSVLTVGSGVSGANIGSVNANAIGVQGNGENPTYSFTTGVDVPNFNSVVCSDSNSTPYSVGLNIVNTNTTANNWATLGFGTMGGPPITPAAIGVQFTSRSNYGTGNMWFFTANSGGVAMTSKMGIFAGGDVVIGGTTDDGYQFEVTGSAKFDGAVTIGGATTFPGGSVIYSNGNATMNGSWSFANQTNLAPDLIDLGSAGVIGMTNGAYVGSSSVDIAFQRNSAGVWEIDDGQTIASSSTNARDLVLRNITINGAEAIDLTPSYVSASVSGSCSFSEPEQGTRVKEVVAYLSSVSGTANYVFPVAFTYAPVVRATSGLPSTCVPILTTTNAVISGTSSTGPIFIDGL